MNNLQKIDYDGFLKRMKSLPKREVHREKSKSQSIQQTLLFGLKWDSKFTLLDKSVYKISFAQFDTNVTPCIKKAFLYAKKWVKEFPDTSNHRVVFWGTSGSGKTMIAHCIRNALFGQEKQGLYVLASAVAEATPENFESIKEGIVESDYIILNELGGELLEQYADKGQKTIANLTKFLDWCEGKHIVVTTNAWLNDCVSGYSHCGKGERNCIDLEGGRIKCSIYPGVWDWIKGRYDYRVMSRLREGAIDLPMIGKDRRI